MTPEPKTLVLVMLLTELLVGTCMLFALRGRLARGVGPWIASHFLQVLALALFALRERLPAPAYLVLYAVLTASTYSLGLLAYARLLEQQVSRWALWLPIGVAAPMFLLLGDALALRIVAAGVLFGAQQLLMVRCLLQSTPHMLYGPSRTLAIGGHAMAVGLYALRMGYALAWPERLQAGDPWLTQITLIVGYCTLIVLAFAFLLMLRDQLDSENRRLARTDSLTGLLNRWAFFEQAQLEWDRGGRRSVQGMAVLMLDLDHFKRINDTLGHAAGDAVLVRCARTLQQTLRLHDVLARYGGEEFVALLPQTTRADAYAVAQRLRQALAQAGGRDPVTVSVGMAWSDDSTLPLQTLVEHADQALYRAKALGRDRVEVGEPWADACAVQGVPQRCA